MKSKTINIKSAILIAICMCYGVFAQAQFSIAPRISVGAALGKFTITDVQVKNKVGIAIGVGSEVRYRLMDIFSIHSGVFYQYIDHTVEGKGDDAGNKIKLKLNYINIPVEAVYGKEKGFYGGVGVNIGIGISGKETLTGLDDSDPEFPITISRTSDIKFDGKKNSDLGNNDNDSHLKRVNVGVSLKAGYSIGKLCFGVNANLGLSELSPNKADLDGGEKYKLSTVSAHVAYVIGGGKSKKD